MINCSDIENNLRLYSDGRLATSENEQVKLHLGTCPVCRQHHADLLEIRAGLRRLQRPEVPAAALRQVRLAVGSERRRGENIWYRLAPDVRTWIMRALMPYSVGALTSVVVGLSFLALLPYGVHKPMAPANYSDAQFLYASNRDPYGTLNTLNPESYARTRLDVAGESPSVNPQGALVALTKSLVRGGMKDDEVVVVADVFGNGLAQITDVVESRDQHTVAELQKALETDPSFAPFVTSSMDNRSDTVKVVLRLQSVDVKTSTARKPRRQS
jgi:hypothetical protein